ncbi:MAG: hypothetical protein ACNA7J_11565, partial [Wenzhouxiangella sp.]
MTPLPVQTEPPSAIRLVISDPDGGYGVYLHDGRVLMFDERDMLVGKHGSPLLAGVRTASRFDGFSFDGNHVIVKGELGLLLLDRRGETDTLPVCSLESLGDRRTLTIFDRDHVSERTIFARDLDGQGGMWMVDEDGLLVRFSVSCEKRTIAGIEGEIVGLSPDPEQASAFVHTSDGRVIHVDLTGIQWQRPLPDFDATMGSVIVPIGSISDGLHVTPYISFELGERLAAFDRAGNLAWIWEAPRAQSFNHARMQAEGALVVTSNGVHLVGSDGLERWSRTQFNLVRDQVFSPHDSRYAWLFVDGFNIPEPHEIQAFDLRTGDVVRWAVGEDSRPVAGRIDGSVIVMRADRIYPFGDLRLAQSLMEARLDGQMVELELPDVSIDSAVAAAFVDETGSLAITLTRDSWTLHGLDTDLKFVWQRGQSIEITSNTPQFQLAANAEVACTLVERSIAARGATGLEVRCFDRRTGSLLFEPVDWGGFTGFLNPEIGDHVEVIHAGPSGGELIRRRFIALDGTIIEADGGLPERLYADRSTLQNVVFGENGQAALVTFTTGNSGMVWSFESLDAPVDSGISILPPPGWRTTFGNGDKGFPSIALGHGQLAMVGTSLSSEYPWPIRTRVVRVHSEVTGNLLWEHFIASPASPSSPTLFRTSSGWLLVQVADDETRLTHFRADDGEILLERSLALEERMLLQSGRSTLMNFTVADDRLIIVSPLPTGTRVHWIDVATGNFVATATSPMLRWNPLALPKPRADGMVIVSGIAAAEA